MLFIRQANRNLSGRLGQVPKVTGKRACYEGRIVLFPPSGGADQAIGDCAEPEVHDEAPIRLKWLVARQVEGWGEKDVGQVAEDYGEESLEQI